MSFRLIFIVSFVITSCNFQERDDIVFDDFEKGTYEGWNVQGVSFKSPIHIDSIPFLIDNSNGKYVAFANEKGEGINWGQGKLISKKIIIERNYIKFFIAGGNNATRECVNLIIENKIVRTASGKNDNKLREVVWDVTSFLGKSCSIEIVDAINHELNKKHLGHIIVDQIIFSDVRNLKDVIFEDFESGTYTNWEVFGEAFSIPRDRENIYYPISAENFNGNYFAFSFGDTYDEKKGKLVSKPFIIRNDFIKFLVGGGSHEGETCINLIINDSVVFSSTGREDGKLREEFWDVGKFKNKTAKIEIVDNSSGGWGHIMVDDIIFYDKPPLFNKTVFIIISVFLVFIFVVIIRYNKRNKFNSEDSEKLDNLKKIITDSQDYTNSEYSIKEVVEISNFSQDEIEFLFEGSEYNSVMDYINYLRVELFKQRINDTLNNTYTMVSIAESCGFSSKTSFYRIFKKVTNMTPSEYKKKMG